MREPTLIITAVGAFLSALAKAAQLLGIIDLDGDQMAGVSLVIDAFLGILTALFIRQAVTSVASPQLPEGTSVNEGQSVVVSNGHA